MATQTLKDRLIDDLISLEGGYVDDRCDSGGETNWGVTVKTARTFGYTGPMRQLPRETAFAIYESMYWDSVRADELAKLSEDVTQEVFDTCVNVGCERASSFLQRALNALNNRQMLYSDLHIDGKIGPLTLSALAAYLETRSSSVIVKALNCLQGAFYIELTEARAKDEKFLYGWLKHRVAL